ncbi:hypothetical protein DPMN_072279 [Dreissena polymorpha]|uniref:Uncharacterized protein n=1 Tax=Dreissena polymorpha TaxID=45954 RepID=A0A9D3Z495_DREPO|nr:hypothetical protein DPMN_072279 [Dreissena polymorpha]
MGPLARAHSEGAYGIITVRAWHGYDNRPIVTPSQGIADGSHRYCPWGPLVCAL